MAISARAVPGRPWAAESDVMLRLDTLATPPAGLETSTPAVASAVSVAPKRIALVGNPNVGKSVIFGALSGVYATVSNFPGTTVEVSRAASRWDSAVEIVDTPGVNSLVPNSEDEQVTRDILLEGVDLVVQVADAKNLPRALILSLQLAEAQVPFVLVLNMMDEATDRGLSIDAAALSDTLGVPVIETIAIRGVGLRHLQTALVRAGAGRYRLAYPPGVEAALAKLQPLLAGHRMGARLLALMCLAGDDTLRPWLEGATHPGERALVDEVRRDLDTQLRGRSGYELNRCRLRAAEQLARRVTEVHATEAPVSAVTPSGTESALGALAFLSALTLLAGDAGVVGGAVGPWVRVAAWGGLASAGVAAYRSAAMRMALGRWASQRLAGLAMLFVVLYVVYRFVGVFAAGTAVDFLEKTVCGAYLVPWITAGIDTAVAHVGPASGMSGATLQLVRNLFVGPYGLITVALTYAFAIILPIVTAFFLAFSVLEDSGYLPRLAVIVNRVFRGMGLNGKAVLPMVLGLGCDTMATLTARIMETRKERVVVTLLLALGVPCSAQLGVILGLFGALPLWAPVVWGGVVAGLLFAVGFLAARVLPGERSDLILEVPPVRRPQLSNILIKTVGRLEWYLKEAVPIFLLGTLVLFILDATGVLTHIVAGGEPVVVGLLQLPARASEAFLIGFFRRDYGSAGIYAMFQDGALSPVQAVVAMVTITLFVPCVANFFVIVKERGWGTAIAMSAFIFPFAFSAGTVVNLALRAVGLR